ncbi:hypothetical protein KJ885_03220 [Patescibacteria group bacterium]|nr:hypothetical protein [Patescibacteria group bacterium]
MKAGTKNYYRGIAIMVGTIVGVGIFGVPYVVAQSGVWIGLGLFLVLGAVLTINHLMFGEIILRTGVKHHLANLAEIYLGPKWEYFAVAITTLGFYGALIAYIILGGEFLEIVLSPFFGANLLVYQILFFAFMAFFVLVGLRLVAFSELLMSALLILAMAVIVFAGVPKVSFANFLGADFKNAFLPYGVILFSLTGAAAVPEVIEIMSRTKKKIKGAIVWGSVIPIVLTLVFAFVVVGVNGILTTPDAVEGLGSALGQWVMFLGAVFGLFAVATSFLILALYLKEQFWFDLKINKHLSWFLACFIPFILFLTGSRDFIKVIGFTGAVFAGLEGILIIWIYRIAAQKSKRKPEYNLRLPFAILFLMVLIFLGGVVYEIWTLF